MSIKSRKTAKGLVAGLTLSCLLLISFPSHSLAAVSTPQMLDLSDPQTVSRWAFVYQRTKARLNPQSDSRGVQRLKTRTGDGTNELVMVERQFTNQEGEVWVEVRLPSRKSRATGWVLRDHLGEFHTTDKAVYVNRQTRKLVVRKRGRVIFKTSIGVGKPKWPTPRGHFYIRSYLTGFKNPMYGPLAFGTSAKSRVLTDWPGGGVIGIHGTNQPQLIPGRISHGCIRLTNRKVRKLAKLIRPGVPLRIY